MDYINFYKNIPLEAQGSILVIGNFDGVHRGHQVLLSTARALAQKTKSQVAVMTFEPHPRKLFRPNDPPFRITDAPIKATLLESYAVDILFSLKFDWNFASQSAEDFVQNVLIDGLKPTHVVVGFDFRFGQMRKGNAQTLRDMGLQVTVINEVCDDDGHILSSSSARKALQQGHIRQANEILGWNWYVQGKVVKGDQRGRELGYPTANFELGETLHPAYGVYAARVQVEGKADWHTAAVNIGIRPMFEIPKAQVESFIFDFNEDIYGKILKVQPVQFLRGEAKFDSLEALINQMNQDCAQAREILLHSKI